MCLIFIAYRVDSVCSLVIGANRDEYFVRPTAEAHFWPEHPEIFGGRDLQEMGTWMAVSTSGRFAAVANWPFPEERTSGYRSRGELVREFLLVQTPTMEFVQSLQLEQFRGCNLILYDGVDLRYWSNHGNVVTRLEPGCHVISNNCLSSPSSRARIGLESFEQLKEKSDCSALLNFLGPRKSPTPNDCFVVGSTYGTRSSTVLTFESHQINFWEQQFGPCGELGSFNSQKVTRIVSTRA